MSLRLLDRVRRFIFSKFSLRRCVREDLFFLLALDCCLQEIEVLKESQLSFDLLAEIGLGLSNDLLKKIDIKKKSLQNIEGLSPDVREQGKGSELEEIQSSTKSVFLERFLIANNFSEESFTDAEINIGGIEFQNERLREDNDWLRECLSERMQDYRAQECLIVNLRKDLKILSQKFEVAEGQRLYCENQIRGLEEQLEFFVMDKTVKESEDGFQEGNSSGAGSHKITAYIKLLQEKDDLLTLLRNENLSLKGHVLDLTNSLERLKMERQLESEKFQEEKDNLQNSLKFKEDELKKSRKDIFKLRDLEQEFKAALLELEVLRDHKSELCDGEENFLRLREHLSKKVKENALLQDKVLILEEKVTGYTNSKYEEIETSEDFNDKTAKFENKLNNLKDLLNRTAEEEGVESLLSNNDIDNYL